MGRVKSVLCMLVAVLVYAVVAGTLALGLLRFLAAIGSP